MVAFNKLLSSIIVALAYVSSSSAAPFQGSTKFSTHRTRDVGNGLKVETYHPVSSFETFDTGIDHPLSKRDVFSLKDAAVAFAGSRLSMDHGAINFRSGYEGEVAHHAFLRQSHNGIPFANAVANVAFNKDNKVVSFGSSFVKPKRIASSTPTISPDQAITVAEKTLDGKFNDHPVTLEYVVKSDNTAVLTHVVQVENDATASWYEAFVDAQTGELVSVTDFVAKASYRVLPVQKEILTEGFETVSNPADLSASPNGWHNTGSGDSTVTSGNNALAYKSSTSGTTTQSSSGLNFVFTQDASQAPTVQANVDAARTNAFYIVNSLHDITYKYGFTEAAYNFQTNNFGKGGAGNDAVQISVQDSSGTNNANFATPADGSPGKMRMFLWTLTSPQRDGALENDIVVHENTHGISNRLTGGGTARCLQTTEAGGMGEGWSDAMADWTEKSSSAVPDYVMGQYVTNKAAGIRTHPYSTSASVNPLRYSSIQKLNEVHDIGEIWANILHNVYAGLVSANGFSSTARTDPTGTAGNVVYLHLFLDALALQPCNPTMLTARDAWIQADVNRYGGANKCTLWKAFASRGLGTDAANHADGTSVPSGC